MHAWRGRVEPSLRFFNHSPGLTHGPHVAGWGTATNGRRDEAVAMTHC
jgi:hypothetical protein